MTNIGIIGRTNILNEGKYCLSFGDFREEQLKCKYKPQKSKNPFVFCFFALPCDIFFITMQILLYSFILSSSSNI